jgi:hypothetical protein
MTSRTSVVSPGIVQLVFYNVKCLVLSDNFTVPLSLVQQTPAKPRPSRLHHGGLWLHQLHRLELPIPPLGIIDHSASADHLLKLDLPPTKLPIHNSQIVYILLRKPTEQAFRISRDR